MVNETKTFAEYKAPKCRVVGIHVQNLVCASPYDDDYGANGYSGKDPDISDLGDDF